MWIVSWDSFLMKKLLKSDVCGSREQCTCARVHCSQEKSTFIAKKKREREKRDVETQETHNPNRTLIKWGDWAILDYNFLHNFYCNLTHNEWWVVVVWIHVYPLSSLHHSQLIMWWVMIKIMFLTFLPQNKIGLDLFMLIFNFLIIKKISMSF